MAGVSLLASRQWTTPASGTLARRPAETETHRKSWRKSTQKRRYPEGMAHATKADKAVVDRRAAAERTRGMFAHLAPGVSLVDELITERRVEARAEDRAERQRAEK
jgi:hypothetical protein